MWLRELADLMRTQPLALLDHTRDSLWALLARDRGGERVGEDAVAAVLRAQEETGQAQWPGVAAIKVSGLIVQHPSAWTRAGLATSTEALTASIRSAVGDPAVRAVVLDIESPGGFTYGVQEAAEAIRSLRDQKPIVAVANAYAASAAYWLASAASEIVVIPSGEVGSIGVYAMHEDWSKFYERMGVTPTLIKAGKHKAERLDVAPLSDEAREYLQAQVEATYEVFLKDVAKGRGVALSAVREGFGQGRMVDAKDAVAEGMADRVGTLQDVVAKLMPRPRRSASEEIEIRRRRLSTQ